MTPGVSVVVPAFDAATTLPACLASLSTQSFSDFEVVVVDNNSSDDTADIARRVGRRDTRVRCVHETTRTRGAARDTGARTARAGILAWTDADCTVGVDWLEKLTAPIRSGQAVAVQGSELPAAGDFWSTQYQVKAAKYLETVRRDGLVAHVDTKNFAIDRRVLAEVGGFARDLHAGEDIDLYFRLERHGYSVHFCDALVCHEHRRSLIAVVATEVSRGRWATRVHRRHPREEHPLFAADSVAGMLGFLPGLVYLTARGRYSPPQSWFELVTGLAWRTGVLSARVWP